LVTRGTRKKGETLKENRLKTLAIVETAAASLAGVLAIVTCFWHDWIEALTGWDPDHHNGSFEVLIIVVLAVVAVACALAARGSWRRYRVRPTAVPSS
jgi:undecaprenyl pyrophosphate phosphatase UppP